MPERSGPLAGVRVIELAGMGALPYGSLRLADMGADVIRVDRRAEVPRDDTPGGPGPNPWDRGRRSIAVDLKHPDGVETVLRLAEGAEVFLESFRPGAAERLGVGPEVLLGRNPAIVYGRLTGWGREGPLAMSAGHSLNYEALTGVIRMFGAPDRPPPPLGPLLGDFAGGGLHLAFGVVCALLEARRSGEGQVVDAAMVDGVSALLGVFHLMDGIGMHTETRGANFFDGGAPHYNVYETADGRWISIAPIEPRFWAVLLDKLGLDPATLPDREDRTRWPELRARLAEVFRGRTRDEWCALLEGTDACFAPVLSLAEAREHPQNVARGVFLPDGGRPALRPTPRLSRTPGGPGPPPQHIGAETHEILSEAGFGEEEIARLRAAGAIA